MKFSLTLNLSVYHTVLSRWACVASWLYPFPLFEANCSGNLLGDRLLYRWSTTHTNACWTQEHIYAIFQLQLRWDVGTWTHERAWLSTWVVCRIQCVWLAESSEIRALTLTMCWMISFGTAKRNILPSISFDFLFTLANCLTERHAIVLLDSRQCFRIFSNRLCVMIPTYLTRTTHFCCYVAYKRKVT